MGVGQPVGLTGWSIVGKQSQPFSSYSDLVQGLDVDANRVEAVRVLVSFMDLCVCVRGLETVRARGRETERE